MTYLRSSVPITPLKMASLSSSDTSCQSVLDRIFSFERLYSITDRSSYYLSRLRLPELEKKSDLEGLIQKGIIFFQSNLTSEPSST